MTEGPILCAVCAWRKNCQKRFLKSKDIKLRCPDFAKDLAIKDTENAEEKDSRDS